ncbi:MAG: SDR family NAD(P)-dependent oxidoreductase [Chloroflexota bacterium]|nr:SDR family NAD(P)-dependent oxidoreductase [Chloroflexota bacterium]
MTKDALLAVKNGPDDRPVLITGGAGFIGTNVAHRLLSEGREVLVYDNLSRAGVEQNLRWLKETHGDKVEAMRADVRDAASLRAAASRASAVFHFAAQVAVTTSLEDPIEDFTVNARGTVNLLEALRSLDNPPPLVFTSTNKVYGGLEDLEFRANGRRYEPADPFIKMYGINERRPLDFHSPYGCSKGAADQYVVDYARTFGIRAVVFRMSCIYGLHQFGTEDQGWVAHFLLRALHGEPITLYGDGMQVRDILFVDDLVNAFMLALKHIDEVSGQAFNMGGGPSNSVSLLEVLDIIAHAHGKNPKVHFGGWRPGDQRYYVSDTARFQAATGWKAQVGVRKGIERLYTWMRENRIAIPAPRPRMSSQWAAPVFPAAVGVGEGAE